MNSRLNIIVFGVIHVLAIQQNIAGNVIGKVFIYLMVIRKDVWSILTIIVYGLIIVLERKIISKISIYLIFK